MVVLVSMKAGDKILHDSGATLGPVHGFVLWT